MDIVLLKYLFRNFRYIATWVFVWVIGQMYCDVPYELVMFSEHYNDRNFKAVH